MTAHKTGILDDFSFFNKMRGNSDDFTILGPNWLMKFKVSNTIDESMQCLKGNMIVPSSKVTLVNNSVSYTSHVQVGADVSEAL